MKQAKMMLIGLVIFWGVSILNMGIIGCEFIDELLPHSTPQNPSPSSGPSVSFRDHSLSPSTDPSSSVPFATVPISKQNYLSAQHRCKDGDASDGAHQITILPERGFQLAPQAPWSLELRSLENKALNGAVVHSLPSALNPLSKGKERVVFEFLASGAPLKGYHLSAYICAQDKSSLCFFSSISADLPSC